jgi:hypothetical protein
MSRRAASRTATGALLADPAAIMLKSVRRLGGKTSKEKTKQEEPTNEFLNSREPADRHRGPVQL